MRYLSVGFLLSIMLFFPTGGRATATSSQAIMRQLKVGQSDIIYCYRATRVAVGDPAIADVVIVSTREVLVNGKSPGATVLYIWDQRGTWTYNVTVVPGDVDISQLVTSISSELNDPRIKVRALGNSIILEGTVSNAAESSRAEALARALCEKAVFNGTYASGAQQEIKSISRPQGDSFVLERDIQQKNASVKAESGLRSPQVVNLIQIKKPMDEVTVRTMETARAIQRVLNNPRLTVRAMPGSVVLLEGRVGTSAEIDHVNQLIEGWKSSGTRVNIAAQGDPAAETVHIVNALTVDSSLARQVVVRARVLDINTSDLKQLGVNWGQVIFDQNGNPIFQNQPFIIGEAAKPSSLLEVGKMTRLENLGAQVQALITENKARVLSEPNLLVLDGQEASMLVGGEVPIPIVQSAQVGSAVGITVEFKEFGVRLKIQPTITPDDRLRLHVMPEVSALDFADAVTFSGFVIPAFSTRRADTTVNIGNGQSLLIGGLISRSQSKVLNKIPLLGDIPVLGQFFKFQSLNKVESDLVILITPQILQPGEQSPAAQQLPTPPLMTVPGTGNGKK